MDRKTDYCTEWLAHAMVFPRDVLNRLKWTEGEDLSEATVWYIHRGAPGDHIKMSGERILSLGSMFFETDEATIPYHRILRIDYREKTLYEKDARAKDLK